MFRVVYLAKRRPGLTPDQFREHYETRHRPLGEKMLGGHALSYERHYLSPIAAGSPDPVYDAVVQLCFADRAGWEGCLAALKDDPSSAAALAEDEERFLDRAASGFFEVRVSLSRLEPVSAGDAPFRTTWFARRRPDMSDEECRAYYENKHRLLGEYIVNSHALNYDRFYLHPIAPGAPEPVYTYFMEMNFPDRASFEQVGARIGADATLRKFIAEDEARFIDRDSAVSYVAEVRRSALPPLAGAPPVIRKNGDGTN